MADRGLDIATLLPNGVALNIPPFWGSRDQLEPDEVLATRRIATHRSHVKRAIERIKNFRLTHFIPSVLCPLAEHIVVCAFLTQFIEPLVPLPTYAVHAVPMPIVQVAGNPPVIAEGRVDAETNVTKASTADQQSGSLDHKASLVPDMTAREMFGADKRRADHPTRSISRANKSSGKDIQVCFACSMSDPCILRTCRNCGRCYHHVSK